MRRRRHHRGARILAASVAGSALAHLLLGFPLRDLANAYLSGAARAPAEVALVELTPDQWSRSMESARRAALSRAPARAADGREEALAKKEEKRPEEKNEEPKKPEPEKLSGQIVEVPPTADDSPNPEAKYLSKYNAHVEKETTARPEDRDPTRGRVTNKLQSTERAAAPDGARITPGLTVRGDGAEADKPGKPKPKAGKEKREFALEVPDLKRRDQVNLKLSEVPGSRRVLNRSSSEEFEGNSDRLRLEMGEFGEDAAEAGGKKGDENAPEKEIPTLAALAPTVGTVARISGSPSRDHVDGVPEGDATFLNTKEFKYATFFYRVRDSVASYWEDLAAREYRRRDPTGNIYGVRDRSTLLHIRLERDGRLKDIRIEQGSGVDFLDSVAVQAFKLAEPFPNPPPGILDQDGTIRFNFQFVVTMRSTSPLNIFRFR